MKRWLLVLALGLAAAPALGQGPVSSPGLPAGREEPRYVLEGIEVRGNAKTDPLLILAEIGLRPGDVVTASDPRVDLARLRLQSLGYFQEVRLSLGKGQRRGGWILVVEVKERGTIVLNALHLGTSEATALWGGLDLSERNFLGRGYVIGGGFVASTTPDVPGAQAGHALSLRAFGPPRRFLGLAGSFLYSDGSEFFRAFGAPSTPDSAQFVAANTRRAGGTISIGADLSRTTRFSVEGRYESIAAKLPALRTRAGAGGAFFPIAFGIQEGGSQLSSLSVVIDDDDRSDPVLPREGHRISLSLETALPFLGSRYAFTKAVAQGSFYFPLRHGHVVALHGFAGGIFGDAPYFDLFFVGDLNFLLPPRALGLNFSTLPSRNLLDNSIAEHRYDPFAARLLVEYAIPMWRRRGFFYRADAFAAFGAFGLASLDDLRARDTEFRRAIPIDLTADVGLRLDTYIGIFKLSIANAIGRVPL